MVRGPRAILIALAVAMPLAACSSSSFDPENLTDKLDFLNPKKKLAGDRKPVFPDGVPGVQQGVPPELMKGYQAPAEPQTADAGRGQGRPGGAQGAQPAQAGQAGAQPGAEEGQAPPPKPKRVAAKPKPKPQPRPQADPAQEPPQRTAVPQQQPQLAPWPNSPPPPPTNTAQPAWPASPAPGTFQR